MIKKILACLLAQSMLFSAAACSFQMPAASNASSDRGLTSEGIETAAADTVPAGDASETFSAEDTGSTVTASANGTPIAALTADFDTDSAAYCVMNDSGNIILCKNPYLPLKPASTTKVLTAMVVLDNAGMNDKVTVSEAAVNSIDVMSSGTDPLFRPGEIFTVKELLNALMLSSSNAAAAILAEYVSGSDTAFAELMNQKCQSLGLTHSHFSNPHGLDADDHYTCAYDLAVIMREACENYPKLTEIMGTPDFTLEATEYADARTVTNGCRFLNGNYTLDGVFAGKPGWTPGANGTLVTAVKRDKTTLYTAVMDSDEGKVYDDTANLVNYAFDQTSFIVPEIHNLFVANENTSSVLLNWSVSGSAASVRMTYWNNAAGTGSAQSQDLGEAAEHMAMLLTLGDTGAYTVQLFLTDTAGAETTYVFSVLFTGAQKQADSIYSGTTGKYYIDNHGLLRTGTIEFADHYAMYADDTGHLLYNSFTPDGIYYCGANGHISTGWLEIDGRKYYFQADGTRATGNIVIEGTLCTFDENGVLQ